MIDRCVCFDLPFTRLRALSEKHGLKTVEELAAHAKFAGNCRMCVPYVKRMLATGETAFPPWLVLRDDT